MDVKVSPYPKTLYDADNDFEMAMEEKEKMKTLKEDQDQGEMDMIFLLGLTVVSIVFATLHIAYPDDKDYEAVGDFALIISNIWAFFPIMQAQGLWLKMILICTFWYSVLWHWTELGLSAIPGGKDFYGSMDTMFSYCIITAYAISWLPKCKTYRPTPEDERGKCGLWYKSCRGPPKETAEWRCRWTPNLFLNIIIVGPLMIYFGTAKRDTEPKIEGMSAALIICWSSIGLALVIGLWELLVGKMKIGEKYRRNFAFWLLLGMITGPVAFVYKRKSDLGGINEWIYHSTWHIYVFSCAYCFSRAQEYLEIY